MNINWTTVKDFLGEISGYKQLYEQTAVDLAADRTTIDELTAQLATAKGRIAELDTLLTEAQVTILALTPTAPAPPSLYNTTLVPTVPDNTTGTDTAPVQPQEGNVIRTIRSQQVIACPREKRDVPLYATEAGANHDQLTCRSCPQYKSETCGYLTCKYQG
jgi:hypothetical protein